MSSVVPAGPELGAAWQTAGVAFVVADGGNADPAAIKQLYYALPSAPIVARDGSGTPVFALTLVLSRAPEVHESSIYALIEQAILSLDVELALGAQDVDEITAHLGGDTNAAVEVRPLFMREALFELRSSAATSPDPLATARSGGGASARASLQCTLNREQALAVLAALDGGASQLTIRSVVTYRASGPARRQLSADWAAVHDFISAHTTGDSITGDDLRRLFSEMYEAGVVHCSIVSSDDLNNLFAAFARQATVILRRLTPELSSVDSANVYALRARPSAGFTLQHQEDFVGSALETYEFAASLDRLLNRLLEGRDRDAFIRLVSLKGAAATNADSGSVSTPPRPQRFSHRAASRDSAATRRPIALAAGDGQLKSAALKLRPEMVADDAGGRNANVMIASGIARPLSPAGALLVADQAHWYLDDWRFEHGNKHKPRHLPVVDDPGAALWADRIDGNRFWYAPVFELVQPAPNADPQTSPFLFKFWRIGESASGPALEGEVRFTLRRTTSEQTRNAIAARPQAVVAPVPTDNLAVSLVLPFVNEVDNQARHHTCPCLLEDNGATITVRVGLTTQWVRIAYTLLSNRAASSEPPRLSVAFSYASYAIVPLFDYHLAIAHKEATIPVMYSAAQVREVQNDLFVDATNATLNFAGGSVLLKREAARDTRRLERDEREDRRGGAALAGVAVAARPQVLAATTVAATARPNAAALGQIATPIARPGIDLSDIIRRTRYAERTLLRQEQHEAIFPCSSLGAFYRDTSDDADVAIGCRPSMELGKIAYRRYERIPELDGVVGGETQYQVYRSLQHPGRFLVLPARYIISRHAPATPDAYEPRLVLYSDEDPLRALATPIVFSADLQPDIPPHARRELDLKLARLAQTPIVEYPTAIECDVTFVFQAMDSTPVTAFRTPDSFSVSVACTAADWPLLFTRLQTGGVVGQARFDLGDGTELSSILSVDLRHIGGPWVSGAVSCDVRTGSIRLTNHIDRAVEVHDILIASGTTSRRIPAERTLAAKSSDVVDVEDVAADAEAYAAYTTPATAEVIEALPNAVERIHINVIFTNQILFSNHALTAMSVFVRRQGATTSEQVHVLSDTTVAQVDFLLPLTEYIARPVVQLRIVKAFSDGSTSIKEWFDWDLTRLGFVVSLTWDLVQS